jgi:TatD DNase family protein
MNHNFIDSHIHLDAPAYEQDRNLVIDRALKAGVSQLITIGAGYGVESARRATEIAANNAFVWATVGVHPHDASQEMSMLELKILAEHPKVIAIGETGLDFVKDLSDKKDQYSVFEQQIALAKECKKPLIIHSRGAGEECLQILKTNNADKVGGVFHCFAEDASFAERLLSLNFLVSFGGILTFKNAKNVRAAATSIPLEQIILETDGPFLAPEPYRGKRCESSYITIIAQQLAAIKNVDVEEVAHVTFESTRKLFQLPI